MEKEHQIELSKILGIEKGLVHTKEPASWAEIYVAIGRLMQREQTSGELPTTPFYHPPPPEAPVHYHNGSPCYNNPCVWCGN